MDEARPERSGPRPRRQLLAVMKPSKPIAEMSKPELAAFAAELAELTTERLAEGRSGLEHGGQPSTST